MNIVILTGRLTKDPELRYIANSGTPVLSFTLAVDREFSTKKETDFVICEVYGKSAESCVNVLTKGFKCGVNGTLRIEQYTNQAGEKKSITKVRANRVEYLESKKGNGGDYSQGNQNDNPFTPPGTPQGFSTINDDDIPF
ncbi:MAG: single-stranded DNA-binding protein [Paraclostridium sp.]